MNKNSFFLDSGAYTAWSKKINIDIDKYISFIKENQEFIDIYANLDVIGDKEGEESYKNWQYMRLKGLNPLPVFHAHADPKYLLLYMEETDYVAIGAISEMYTLQRVRSLDRIWRNYLLDDKGYPKVRCHGFGLTAIEIMIRYPWYSSDSMSWSLMGAYGSVLVPPRIQGKRRYDIPPYKIFVSNQSPTVRDEGKHFSTITPQEKEDFLSYIEEKGFILGGSEIKEVGKSYVLQKSEGWFLPDHSQVESITEIGLLNSYKERAGLNIVYFQDFEMNQPEWPWSVLKRSTLVMKKGFELGK